MTPDEKLCYSEGTLWRNRVKAQCIAYAGEVVREDPYSLIPADAERSAAYHASRVRVSQSCLAQPDMFAQQNAGSVALTLPDPVLAEDLAIKGAIINLWEILAGGIPAAPPEAPPLAGREGLAEREPAQPGREPGRGARGEAPPHHRV